MRKIITFILIINTLLSASSIAEKGKKTRAQKQLEIEMEKEKKYSRERTFYKHNNYDFKGAEINPASLDSVPDLQPQDDFDMDSVYD